MTDAQELDELDVNRFWWVVVNTLVDFFEVDLHKAVSLAVERKKRVESSGKLIIYHREPYDVAEALAKQIDKCIEMDADLHERYLHLSRNIMGMVSIPSFDTNLSFEQLERAYNSTAKAAIDY